MQSLTAATGRELSSSSAASRQQLSGLPILNRQLQVEHPPGRAVLFAGLTAQPRTASQPRHGNWGRINAQPALHQVLKTNMKLDITLSQDATAIVQRTGASFTAALVCETVSGKEYAFRGGIELQKVQVKRGTAYFKIFINTISMLKKETTLCDDLPLNPTDRKAKARFWIRFFFGQEGFLDSNRFYLFIRRDELRLHAGSGANSDDMDVDENSSGDKMSQKLNSTCSDEDPSPSGSRGVTPISTTDPHHSLVFGGSSSEDASKTDPSTSKMSEKTKRGASSISSGASAGAATHAVDDEASQGAPPAKRRAVEGASPGLVIPRFSQLNSSLQQNIELISMPRSSNLFDHRLPFSPVGAPAALSSAFVPTNPSRLAMSCGPAPEMSRSFATNFLAQNPSLGSTPATPGAPAPSSGPAFPGLANTLLPQVNTMNGSNGWQKSSSGTVAPPPPGLAQMELFTGAPPPQLYSATIQRAPQMTLQQILQQNNAKSSVEMLPPPTSLSASAPANLLLQNHGFHFGFAPMGPQQIAISPLTRSVAPRQDLLSLARQPDPVQICTQVIKPYITARLSTEALQEMAITEGHIEVQLIWSCLSSDVAINKLGSQPLPANPTIVLSSPPGTWKTLAVPSGLYYETNKVFVADTTLLQFKHIHVNNWSSIKAFVREHIPGSTGTLNIARERLIKLNYGLRFNIKSNDNTLLTYVDMPALFSLDIRRENDPTYTGRKGSGLKSSGGHPDLSSSGERPVEEEKVVATPISTMVTPPQPAAPSAVDKSAISFLVDAINSDP